jgi:hypothetical protein
MRLQIAIGFFVKPLNSFPADSFIELVNVFARIEQIARANFKKIYTTVRSFNSTFFTYNSVITTTFSKTRSLRNAFIK